MSGADAASGAAVGHVAPIAANPLPIARRGVVRLPLAALGDAPAVVDPAGARFPTQRDGEAVAVELPLGALEARPLAPHAELAAGARWEVSPTTLDNGRVRLELDRDGRLERWCVDGQFAPLAEPIGFAGWRADSVIVEATGPVFARVVASGGGQRIAYELRAHHNDVIVSPSAAPLRIALHGVEDAVGGDIDGRRRRLLDGGPRRWAALLRRDGSAVATLAAAGNALVQRPGDATVIATTDTFALALPGRRRPAPLLAAQSLAAPFALAIQSRAPTWRLVDLGSLALREPAPTEGLGLVETLGSAGRAWLFAPGVTRAWRVTAEGAEAGELPLSPERDAIQLDYEPGEVLLVRWR